MKIVLLLEGVAAKVLTTPFLQAYETEEGYTLKGETLQLDCVEPEHLLILPDDAVMDEDMVITDEWRARALPIASFIATRQEDALSDTLGLLLRDAVARESITDMELLRIQPALQNRVWKPGLDVVPGDVYCDEGLLYRCVQAHTTQADWKPGLLTALWRRVRPDAAIEIWQVNTDYAAGDVVGYPDEAILYTCKQGHTSQAGWEPPNIPALWERKEELM